MFFTLSTRNLHIWCLLIRGVLMFGISIPLLSAIIISSFSLSLFITILYSSHILCVSFNIFPALEPQPPILKSYSNISSYFILFLLSLDIIVTSFNLIVFFYLIHLMDVYKYWNSSVSSHLNTYACPNLQNILSRIYIELHYCCGIL